jgi:polyisoprenoid-binding protein YceI
MRGHFTKVIVAGGFAAVLALPVLAGVKTYKIDPQHSSAQFAVTHLMISKVRG